jgi:hypothetical protein
LSNRELALEFIRRFCAGDVEGLAPLLGEDLDVQGPGGRFRSRAEYLDALEKDPPEKAGFQIISVTESEGGVAVCWDYQKRGGTLTIAQLFRFRDGAISESVLVFDRRRPPPAEGSRPGRQAEEAESA